MAIINEKSLQQYLKLNYNVLITGRHGVGKTSIIKNTFAGLKWKYFSAPTLDPWVDLVGSPKEKIRSDGQSAIQLIRPDWVMDDDVEAIFIDELNRAPPKVLDAIMEMIQFKSINGKKLGKLRVVWAAINPSDDDGTYSVGQLDPAQIDRFEVHLTMPFKVDEDYFNKKYPTTGKTFITWWNAIPKDIRYNVSPRRLDMAADAWENNCRLEDFLPYASDVKALREALKLLPFADQLKNTTTQEEAEVFVRTGDNALRLLEMVKAKNIYATEFFKKYGELLPKEIVVPFVEYLHAVKNGMTTVSSVIEFIEKLPTDKANQGTAAIINNVNFEPIFRDGSKSLAGELASINVTHPELIRKLAQRVIDIFNACKPETISRLFWGLGGKVNNKPTNLQNIVKALGRIDGVFSATTKNGINQVLSSHKIVDTTYFV